MASFSKDITGRKVAQETINLVEKMYKEQFKPFPDFSLSEYSHLSNQEKNSIKTQITEYNRLLKQRLWEELI